MVKTLRKSESPKSAPRKAKAGEQLALPICPPDANWFLHRRTVALPFLHGSKKPLSQYDIGFRTRNYTGSAVGSWERFISAPPVKEAQRLAQAYEVSVEEMIKRIQELELQIAERTPAAPVDASAE